jgi:hypothetical protein
MDKRSERLIENWRRRNITGFLCADKAMAAQKILDLIPASSSVGFSGSQTLEQLGVIERLKARGGKVFDPYEPGLDREESLAIRKQAAQADFYLASPNAVTENGELVFFSAYGNRTAGVSFARNVIVAFGINKITPDLAGALKRAREYSTPLNCKRLNWNTPCLKDGICRESSCFSPEYKRMCCQVLIIEAEAITDRLKAILVNENLGF